MSPFFDKRLFSFLPHVACFVGNPRVHDMTALNLHVSIDYVGIRPSSSNPPLPHIASCHSSGVPTGSPVPRCH